MVVEFETTGCMCGFYVYQERWSPIVDERLNVNANLKTQETIVISQR